MTRRPYGLLCPISRACEFLEPRWTIQILTELWNGSTRFNDIRKGVGNISSALLSRRLKEMEALGLVERIEDEASGTIAYFRTEKSIKLEPAMAVSTTASRRKAAMSSSGPKLAFSVRNEVIDEQPVSSFDSVNRRFCYLPCLTAGSLSAWQLTGHVAIDRAVGTPGVRGVDHLIHIHGDFTNQLSTDRGGEHRGVGDADCK